MQPALHNLQPPTLRCPTSHVFVRTYCVLSYRIPANNPGIDTPPSKNTKFIPSCLPLAPEVLDGIGAIDVRVGDDGLATTDNEPLTGEELVATIVGVAVAATRWTSMEQSASNQTHALELTGGT